MKLQSHKSGLILAASITAAFGGRHTAGTGPGDPDHLEIAAEAAPTATALPAASPPAPARELDVPYVPTSPEVVRAMLRMANVKEGDVVYDLGCGDGRIVIAAAKDFGATGVGVDLDPQRIKEARENARAAGVADKVEFVEGDLFEADFSKATVLTLYLYPDVNMKLRPKIMRMRPGTRIVSHAFDMGDWKPEQTVQVDGSILYLWISR